MKLDGPISRISRLHSCFWLTQFRIQIFTYNIKKDQQMPGSYRAINFILKTIQIEKVKQEAEISQEEESEMNLDQREGPEGKWSQQQNFKYTLFVNYYQGIFASKHKRKVCKIFKLISEYLQPRTPTQCRSHFQKLLNKHKSITKLKRYYKTQVGQSVYRKKLSEFRKEWQLNHQPLESQYPEIKETKEYAVQTEPQDPNPCSNCRNMGQDMLCLPSLNEFSSLPQLNYWNDSNQLQSMLSTNYMFWISNLNQENPRV